MAVLPQAPGSPVPAAGARAPSISHDQAGHKACKSWGDGRRSGRSSKGCSWRATCEQLDSSYRMCAGHQSSSCLPLACVCRRQRALTLPGPSAVSEATTSTKPRTRRGGGCHRHWHLRARCQMPRKRQRGLSRELQRRVCCCLPKLTSLTKGMILKLHHQTDGLLEYGRPRNGKDE